jgi:hypothetical protein
VLGSAAVEAGEKVAKDVGKAAIKGVEKVAGAVAGAASSGAKAVENFFSGGGIDWTKYSDKQLLDTVNKKQLPGSGNIEQNFVIKEKARQAQAEIDYRKKNGLTDGRKPIAAFAAPPAAPVSPAATVTATKAAANAVAAAPKTATPQAVSQAASSAAANAAAVNAAKQVNITPPKSSTPIGGSKLGVITNLAKTAKSMAK